MIKITLTVDGMMCGMCEAHMNDAIRKNFNVKKVTSSHVKKETVIIASDKLDEEKLCAVVAELGYELKAIKQDPYEKKGLFARLTHR